MKPILALSALVLFGCARSVVVIPCDATSPVDGGIADAASAHGNPALNAAQLCSLLQERIAARVRAGAYIDTPADDACFFECPWPTAGYCDLESWAVCASAMLAANDCHWLRTAVAACAVDCP